MGYLGSTGVWLGYCPHAAWIDRESCCISLNIIPIVYGVCFMCLSERNSHAHAHCVERARASATHTPANAPLNFG